MQFHSLPATAKKTPLWLVIAVLGLLTLVSGGLAYRASERAGLALLDDVAYRQLDLYASALENELGKYAYLPSLMELDPDVTQLFGGASSSDIRKRAHRSLVNLNVRAGAKALFLVGVDGRVLASSEALSGSRPDAPTELLEPLTHVSAQPFFTEAVAQQRTQFFASSRDSSASEYFFAQPYLLGQQVRGVMGVQISLAPLEATWVDLGVRSEREELMVVDESGVVIMSSVPRWKYRSLTELTAVARLGLAALGRYPPGAVLPLNMKFQADLERGAKMVEMPATPAAPALSRVLQERALPQLGWRLLIFSDPQPVQSAARSAAWGAAAVMAFVCLLALYLLHRRRATRQLFVARNALQAVNSQLENLVEKRTLELSQTNQQLVAEIRERVLAQGELVQAGKLAVLGQMSAGVAHEISQPLTALRALSTNAALLLGSGRAPEALANLKAIGEVTARMQGITAQLKSFARKSQPFEVAFAAEVVVQQLHLLLAHRLASEQLEWAVDLEPGLPAVFCDSNRLLQVLLNLAGNALDAMAGESFKRLTVAVCRRGGRIELSVADTGPVVPDDAMKRLFEPFFSTKPAGQGLGLGLVISSNIVREFGGILRAERVLPQGLRFVFDVPAAALEGHAVQSPGESDV